MHRLRRPTPCACSPSTSTLRSGRRENQIPIPDDRTARWLDATYDWSRREQGPVRSRAYAALNLVGAATKSLGLAVASVVPGGKRATRRHWARELARAVPVHARAVLQPGGGSVRTGPEGGELSR